MDETSKVSNFIQDIIEEDLRTGKVNKVHTRFPPEPNGYLHIGHAKAICIDFGMAEKYNGLCNLRFDDTNPTKEDIEYVDSIIEDIKWLGFDWEDRLYYASDYYDQFYDYAVTLVKKGLAYVDDLTAEEIREYRGTLTEPGKDSPYRNRSIEENLDLFERMKNGEFDNGERVLRAKIDMASPNMNMRDPVIYRILKAPHHRTGDKWCIYPMYDFAHPLEDAIENITHSLCSLEFEDHRPLYDWFLEKLEIENPPRQFEFARLNLTYTMMSKRKLRNLVENNIVDSWDDPRMPTLSGLRRRGFTPASIRNFCDLIGVSKTYSVVDYAFLEHCIREDLNKKALRVMAILDPLKVIIDNYPEDLTEEMDVENNPEAPETGTRKVPFSRELYIERDDFQENPPKKYFRLKPGAEVRLKNAYIVKCESFVKDDDGNIIEVHCTYDPESRGGSAPDGRKVRGTIQWVSARHAEDAEVRLYDHLFTKENPDDVSEDGDYMENINPDSLIVLKNCKLEPSLKGAKPGEAFQFIRTGYFCVDSKEYKKGNLVFNRTVSLKDTWAKIVKKHS
ncbi:MAG: glutamine--tRNA ligase/YqeY domain fusion protein [Clostridiaceae bacterium]|jgi:glutaminyl-tRNA synthetase|nr:glutamine--tRNA ligase/YqeY domain fusion protein [Clostridiaceae bacterium]